MNDQGRVEEIWKVVVHSFDLNESYLGSKENEAIVADILNKWENSETGKWVIEHSIEKPKLHHVLDLYMSMRRFKITAKLRGTDMTYWELKYT
jgi:hypothetical protein